MSAIIELSVAICTRNRHEDLWKCIESIAVQQGITNDRIEVIIVDDGDTDAEWLEKANELLGNNNIEFRYFRKERSEAGLIKSRIKSVEISKYEDLLFLDDDVELAQNYFMTLKKTLADYPDAVGISGVDQGLSYTAKGRAVMLLSGRSRLSPGKLSFSGFAAAMNTWSKHTNVFRTEFLHGCNMFFRKRYLSEVEAVDWLQGYSLGEDLYVSYLAGTHGNMYVNPALKLIHHGSPTSRDKIELVSYTNIINHYHLLKTRNKLNTFGYLMLRWTAGFLSLEAKIKNNEEAYTGYKRGAEKLKALYGTSSG